MSELKAVPDGYHSIQPYLMFEHAGPAIAFYVAAFGAVERLRMQGPDGRVGHAEIQIGDSCVMMADENSTFRAYGAGHYHGSPISLLLYTEDCDAVYMQAVEAGAEGVREPSDQPHGDRMGAVKDPFGYTWYITTHIKDVTKQELEQMY